MQRNLLFVKLFANRARGDDAPALQVRVSWDKDR